MAGAAATGVPMKEVVELFQCRSHHVFPRRLFQNSFLRSKYSTDSLKEVLQEYVPSVTMGEVSTPLMITSSNLTTGEVNVFKSGYRREQGGPYLRDKNIRLTEAILASCAAPLYFDPAMIGESLLADGGLWANNPSVIALTEALSRFRRNLKAIHILSIGTGQPVNLYKSNKRWGMLTGWGKEKLISFVFDLQSQASENIAKLLLEERYIRVNPHIEPWSLDDTEPLPNLKALANSDFTSQSKTIMRTLRKK